MTDDRRFAAILRVWTNTEGALSLLNLQHILRLLAQPVVALSYQPHPELTQALELRLEHALASETIAQLRELSASLALELNYLTSQP